MIVVGSATGAALLILWFRRVHANYLKEEITVESTINTWKKHEMILKSYYWKENTLWSDGYFCCTIGNVSETTIMKYIQEQG